MPEAMTLSLVPCTDGTWDVVWSACDRTRPEKVMFSFRNEEDARDLLIALATAHAVRVSV